MAKLKILEPRDGDVVDHNDGKEDDAGLTIAVKGTAPSGAAVTVNGAAAVVNGETFSCDVRLDKRRVCLAVEAGGEKDAIEIIWNKGSRKRFRFSVDDNIQFLKDLGLNAEKFASIFEHWYLKFWLDMHREFGMKVHFNIYYQTDGFDLTDMPDKWKDEWQANADWLRLSFHALQDKPDRPYRHATYAQLAHDYDLVCGHIRRFAGNESLRRTTTVHWAECPKPTAAALRDRGIENLIGLFTVQGYGGGTCTTGYYLPVDQCAYCDSRGAWFDRETGLMFIRCTAVVNAIKLEEVETFLNARTNTPQTAEMVELLIHEQYFRKELEYYQPDVMDKVKAALRWVTQRGYEPVFWSDGFLGVG